MDADLIAPLALIALSVLMLFQVRSIERRNIDEMNALRARCERDMERVHGAYLAKIDELLAEIRQLRNKE